MLRDRPKPAADKLVPYTEDQVGVACSAGK